MKHEIYTFGSICRGEVTATSDVDILLIPFGSDINSFPNNWSIYSADLLKEYYSKGRLFAWHLHLESKCIHSPTSTSYLESLGKPSPYETMLEDINDLEELLMQALDELRRSTNNTIFELGIVYTAIRDIAMSASWNWLGSPSFSSNAPFLLPQPCPVNFSTYNIAKLARHSSTRGYELNTDTDEAIDHILTAPLNSWIKRLKG